MSKKEQFKQKMQAHLKEWEADLDKLKAKVSGASTNAQLELNKEIKTLKGEIEQIKIKLVELAEASEEAWESIKEGVDSAKDSLKAAFRDAKDKFKKK